MARPIIPLDDQLCRVCLRERPMSKFGINRNYARGFNTTCRECVNLQHRYKYHTYFGERQRELTQSWRERNPEKYAESQARARDKKRPKR